MILLACALLSVFGSNVAQFSGAGALGVLVMATVASYGWGDLEKVGTAKLFAENQSLEENENFFQHSVEDRCNMSLIPFICLSRLLSLMPWP